MIDSSDVPPISEAAALDVITKLAAEFERLDENERPRRSARTGIITAITLIFPRKTGQLQ